MNNKKTVPFFVVTLLFFLSFKPELKVPNSLEGNSEDNIDNNITLNSVIISPYCIVENLTKLNKSVQPLSVN